MSDQSQDSVVQETPKSTDAPAVADKFYPDNAAKVEAKPSPTPEPVKVEDKKLPEETKPVLEDKKPEAGEVKAEAAKDSKEPVKAPEKYELAIPKDSLLATDRIEAIKAYAKQNELSNEDAQNLLEIEVDAVKSFHATQVQQLETKKTEWLETAANDKEIGGEKFTENVELAKRALDKYGSAQLRKELNDTGLGNHPELLRTFVRIGKEMGEDKFVKGRAHTPQPPKSAAEIFYPNHKE